MTSAKEDQERAERDHDRSEEARWRVAEAEAETAEERLSQETRQSDAQQNDWDNEGGAPERDQ